MPENFTSGENLENDIETAQVMGSSINKFVDQGVMTATEASKLDPDKIDEFMCRSTDDIINMPDKIPEENKGKLRTMLGLHLTEFDKPIDKIERQAEIKETVAEMQDYLAKFQEKFPFIKGMILCGSRMVEDKMPRPDSDVDVVLVLDDGHETSHKVPGGQELVQSMVKFTDKNRTKSGAEVSLDDFYTMSALYDELVSDKADSGKGKLIWGFNPEAVLYIGDDLKFEDKLLNEKVVNRLLDLHLNSAKTKELKKQVINDTKKKILKQTK